MTTRIVVRLADAAIDVGALLDDARSDADGAIDMFLGMVRDHSEGLAVSRLDYEAYIPMAEAMMRQAAEDVAAGSGVTTLVAVHRLGSLAVGEIAIAVAAAAPHRREAFAACRALVDAIKADVPIFKREHLADGTRWVANTGVPAEAR